MKVTAGMKVILPFFIALFAAQTAWAQQAPAPPTAPEQPPAAATPAQPPLQVPPAQQQATPQTTPLSILVIGDGLAGGLGAGLTRLGEEEGEPVTVDNRFDETAGLTRPENFSWSTNIASLPVDNTYTTAVILSGINDKREFRKGADRFVFGTPEWKTAYTTEVDAMLAALKAKNIRTFFVSLPPMQNLTFDTEMQLLNSIHKERVAAAGGSYIDIRPAFLGADGQYTDRGPDGTGAVRKLRSRDGITFFKTGNNLMANLVYDAIRNGGAPAPAAAPTPTTTAPAPGTTPSILPTTTIAPPVVTGPLPTVPVFAEPGSNGTDVLLPSSEVKIAEKPDTSGPQKIGIAAGSLGVFTPLKGTSAEQLLSTGDAGTAPTGRFDDFSVEQ